MKEVSKIIELLKKEYPKSKLTLEFETPLQLLVATILAAQFKDVLVNGVTKDLFKKYKTAKDFADANFKNLVDDIGNVTFAGNKAKYIKESCRIIVEKYRNEVPKNMEELIELPGVGRKTANVVLGNAYHILAGLEVDRHIARVSYRLGLSKSEDPEKIEQDLMNLIPKNEWLRFTHTAKDHGRAICKAPDPYCSRCMLNELCPKAGVEKQL